MVGLRTLVAVRMILYLEGSASFLEYDPHGLGLVGCPEIGSLLGSFRMLAPEPGYPFGVPGSPLKEISTQLISGTSSILGDS